MFRAIIEDREVPLFEKGVDGYKRFLFYDKNGLPLIFLHWEHRIQRMKGRYNELYKLQIPSLSPHICRHTYCTNMAGAGMNPKTLQYLMGHSDISITMNVYTHLGLDDAKEDDDQDAGTQYGKGRAKKRIKDTTTFPESV
jgi:integrase